MNYHARQAKLAEIQQREKEALEEYDKLLSEIRDDALRPMEELHRRINETNAEQLEYAREQARLEKERLATLREVELQVREILAANQQTRADIFADSNLGRLNPCESVNRQANAARDLEDVRSTGITEAIRQRRDQLAEALNAQKLELEEYLLFYTQLNRQEEAEAERHQLAIEAIEQRRINQLQQISPLQERFNELGIRMFGDQSQAAIDFAQIAGQAFSGFASGIGQAIEQWVLLGNFGPDAMRRLTASVLAGVAAQAAVKAIFYLAEGIAAATNPFTAWMAPGYFAAAKTMGIVAGIAAVAGRAIAPSAGSEEGASSSNSGLGGSNRRTFNQDSSTGFRELITERGRTVLSSSSGSAGGRSSGGGLTLVEQLLSDIREFTERIMLSFDRYVEYSPAARKGSSRIRNGLLGVIGGLFGFDRGGFTGSGLNDAMAGIVHANEYVFSAPAVRTLGLNRLERMHQAARLGQVETGGWGGGRDVTITVKASPEVIVDTVVNDLKGNGVTRQFIRQDLGAE